jgi:hydroxyversicolorone monooxygenase
MLITCNPRISGIQLAHDITRKMTDYEFDIYEKNSGLGGTWFENKYPGCVMPPLI